MVIRELASGRSNICGTVIRYLRINHSPRITQNMLCVRLQLAGLDWDRGIIQRIESGRRSVNDIELKTIAHALEVPYDILLEPGGLSIQ